MKNLFKHITDGGFSTLAFTARTPHDVQDAQVPVRVLPTVFTDWVSTDGVVDLDKAKRELERRMPLPHDVVLLDAEGDPLFKGRTAWSTLVDDDGKFTLDMPTAQKHSIWQQFIDTVAPILEALRTVDRKLKWGIYGTCPSLDVRHVNGYLANPIGDCVVHKNENQEEKYREWLHVVEMMRYQAEHLAPLVDWYCPELYPRNQHTRYAHRKERAWYFWDAHTQKADDIVAPFAAQTEEHHVQRDIVNVGLSVARHILPPKPLIPLFMVQWFETKTEPWQHEPGEFVSLDWIRNCLYPARILADSVAFWAEPGRQEMTPAEFYKTSLWRFIKRWTSAQQIGE